MSRVLRIASYRRLLLAYTLNELAWSIGSVALAILVYRRTGSALGAMAFFLCSQFVPAVLSPALVARFDRYSARPVLVTLYGVEALLFGALAWITSHFALAPALALVVADGALALTARAIARAATVQVTRGVGLLREGNAFANASFSVCFMVGPAIGATIVSLAGTAAALLANTALFAAIVCVLATTSGLHEQPVADRGTSSRLRTALAYVKEHRQIRALFLVQAVALLFFTISIPVEIVFVQRSLHAGTKAYGALLSAWGAGTVVGSVIYARWRTVAPATLIAAGSATLGVGFVFIAAAPSIALASAGATLSGIGNGVVAVAARTALQEEVDDSWMPMMMSFNETVWQAVPGVGIAIGGVTAALAGPRPALVVGGAGALLVAVVAPLVLRPPPHRLAVALGAGAPAVPSAIDEPAPEAAADADAAGPQ